MPNSTHWFFKTDYGNCSDLQTGFNETDQDQVCVSAPSPSPLSVMVVMVAGLILLLGVAGVCVYRKCSKSKQASNIDLEESVSLQPVSPDDSPQV